MSFETFVAFMYGFLAGGFVAKFVYMYMYRNWQPKPKRPPQEQKQ